MYYTAVMGYTGGTTIRQGSLWLISGGTSSMIPSGYPVILGDEETGENAIGIGLAGGSSGPRPNMQLHVTEHGTLAIIQAGLNGQSAGSYIVYGTIQIDRPYLILRCNTTANDLLVSSVISGIGGIDARGTDTKLVRLNAANSYSGGTLVSAGRLRVFGSGTLGTGSVEVYAGATLQLDSATAIADDAAVSLNSAEGTFGRIDLSSGVSETVGTLTLGGELQYAGTYGATGSGAATINDDYFVGTGKLVVLGGKVRSTVISIR